MLTVEDLADRRTGIGSSDAAAVCGIHPKATAYGVYLAKLGQLPELQPNAAMRWGIRLEHAIADGYTEETGVPLITVPRCRHPEHNWMLASIDRLTADRRKIDEIKTAGLFHSDEWGEPGTDQVPEPYVVQVQHQMAVTNLNEADIAVLIGGQDFRIYSVLRSNRLIEHLIEILDAFWQRILDRRPPDPDWQHPTTPQLIAAIGNIDDSLVVDLDQDILECVKEYQSLGQSAKATQDRRATAKAKILHAMGDAALARLPDGYKLTRESVTRKAYSVAETTYIDFRVKTPR